MSWLLAISQGHKGKGEENSISSGCLSLKKALFTLVPAVDATEITQCFSLSLSLSAYRRSSSEKSTSKKRKRITIRFGTARSFAKLSVFVREQHCRVDHDPIAEQHQLGCIECLNTFARDQYYLETKANEMTDRGLTIPTDLIRPCSISIGHI